MAMAAADPSPAAVMTWARGLTALPAAQTPGDAGAAGGVGDDPAVVVGGAAEAGRAGASCGTKRGRTKTRARGHDPAVVELDAGEPVVLDDEPGDRAVDDADRPGGRAARARSAVERRRRAAKSTTSSDHWRTSWACATRLGRAAEHAERLVADLVAVAVRAVQQVAAPALAHAGDVGELVAQPGGDQHAAGAQRRGRRRGSPRSAVPAAPRRPDDAGDRAGDELAAVARRPPRGRRPAARRAAGRREPRKPCMCAAGALRGAPGVDHGDPAPGAGQDQGGGQAGGAAADDHHVVLVHVMQGSPLAGAADNDCCRFRESRGAMSRRGRAPTTARRARPSPRRSTRSARGCGGCASSAG